jgi:pimeloyl-ACP methyl ester carboxylesterase
MTAPQPADVEVTDSLVSHPEGRIHVRTWTPATTADEAQTGGPIVLFHDSLGCVELWRDFPARLCAATGRRVIAYDRLGFGQSGARSDRPGLDFIAEEAGRYFAVLREQLGLRGFVLFGHSVGGGMAVNCAAAFPDECEALITVAAQAFTEDRTTAGIEVAKAEFADTQQFQRLVRYHGDKARWVLEAWTETWLHPGFAGWSIADALPKVRCPVLAIHGTEDEYGSTRHPQMIAELSAGPARAEILADTGHVPHRERPEQVLELITGFLAGR